MHTLLKLLKHIASHPLNRGHKFKAITRFAKWQIAQHIMQVPVIYSFTEKSKLIIKKGMTGATQNLYCGLQEYEEMLFLLHFLRKEDIFADVGANVGSYTILASGHIGCKSFSFEPIPSTFENLLNNIVINRLNNVNSFNMALGAKTGKLEFTQSDTTSHVANKNEQNTISVPVETLDNIFADEQIPRMIKIDVEGFETEVLLGGDKLLRNRKLQVIIIELIGEGKRYGYDEKEIHNKLVELGFIIVSYNPQKRSLSEQQSFSSNNLIYIRDKDFVLERLRKAEKITILGNQI
jgi:FkbM family methyltransferase